MKLQNNRIYKETYEFRFIVIVGDLLERRRDLLDLVDKMLG